jgi:hypothetical protein
MAPHAACSTQRASCMHTMPRSVRMGKSYDHEDRRVFILADRVGQHAACCIWHVASGMLHLACCIWHVACWTLMLHVASGVLCCIWHVGHVAWWTLHVASVASGMLHVAGDREATEVFRAEQAVRDGLDHPAGEGGASRSVPCHICTGIRLTQPHARPPTPLTPFPTAQCIARRAQHRIPRDMLSRDAVCYAAWYSMRHGIPRTAHSRVIAGCWVFGRA